MLTHDANLWQHWRGVDPARWLPARGESIKDLTRWRNADRSCAIVDSSLPNLPTWDSPAWQGLCADMHILIASSRPSDDEASQALIAGSSGYLHAYSPPEVLSRALDSITSGGIWMGRSLVSRMLREVSRRMPPLGDWAQSLTEREKEIAQRAAMGSSNQDIADALSISERTVRAHLSAAFEKLGVNDRLQLALRVHGVS